MKFSSYHPLINLIYFTVIVYFTLIFNHPVFLTISFLSGFVYSVKLGGKKVLAFNIALLPMILIFSLWYSFYNHFGVTVVAHNFIGNQITLEAFVYGLVLGFIAAAVFMWLSCIHNVFTTDKVVYLFGCILPKLSLYISIVLRTVPRIKDRYRKIISAQRCVGRDIKNVNLLFKLKNFFRAISILITWTVDNFADVSGSMKNRGYTLKGRTAFSIYRFDNRDRTFVTVIFWSIIFLLVGAVLNQTHVIYNPRIIINRITPVGTLFYIVYLFYCVLPLALQIVGEYRFSREIERISRK